MAISVRREQHRQQAPRQAAALESIQDSSACFAVEGPGGLALRPIWWYDWARSIETKGSKLKASTSISAAIGCFVLVLAAAIIPAAAAGDSSAGARPAADANVIEGSYIVVYTDAAGATSSATDAREDALGFESDHRYRSALHGFSAKLSDAQVRALETRPRCLLRAAGSAPPPQRPSCLESPGSRSRRPAFAESSPPRATWCARQRPSTSPSSIRASTSAIPTSTVSTARTASTSGRTAEDGNGHGTHVAGTIGARNNGAGVVGVAPNTRIYAVRVLNNAGSGSFAQIICGIDWVTANAATKNIEVANMSLGGLLGSAQSACPGTTDALHLAICNSTDANTNVTYVVAAGNSDWDFDFGPNPDVPAAYREVLTTTAVSDSDGRPGALGPVPTCRTGETDDRRGIVLELCRDRSRFESHDRRAGRLHQLHLARRWLQHRSPAPAWPPRTWRASPRFATRR